MGSGGCIYGRETGVVLMGGDRDLHLWVGTRAGCRTYGWGLGAVIMGEGLGAVVMGEGLTAVIMGWD